MIDLKELLRILLHRRWWLVAGFVLGSAVGVTVALTSTPTYRAEVLLQPVKRGAGGGVMQALANQVGGLASLAGLSIAGSDDSSTAIATLKSRLVTRSFIEEENLLPVLYPDLWDEEQGQWKVADPKRVPTAWGAEQMFSRRIRKITENRGSGLVSLSIDWKDPDQAAEWARKLVQRTNDLLRKQAHDTARRNIEFLQKQLESTNLVEVRQSMNRLLEDQWNQLMLSQGESEYAFKTIDPAVVPEGKINLPRRIVVLAWAAAGLLLACMAAVAERMAWAPPSRAPELPSRPA